MNASFSSLSHERLKSLLEYDPATGSFTWRQDHSARARKGMRAGSDDGAGYEQIRIDGRKYRSHRLAWFYVHGQWPALVDHLNGQRSMNHLANLREATPSVNGLNRHCPARSASGVRGVSWDRRRRRWEAHIKVDRRKISLGMYIDKAAAAKARAAAERRALP